VIGLAPWNGAFSIVTVELGNILFVTRQEFKEKQPSLFKIGTATVIRQAQENSDRGMPGHAVRLLSALFITMLSAALVVSSGRADYDPLIDSPMYKNPELPTVPIVYRLPSKAPELWLRALERPEADFRYQAAHAICLAHERGFGGLEGTIEPLRKALNRPDEQPLVRLAVAQALIELDAHAAAADLWQQALAGDSDLRQVVEPVLARWDYKPARAVWLERLHDPATPADSLKLAIIGLATVREEQAADALRDIVLLKQEKQTVKEPADASSRSSYVPCPPSIRLEAAGALALLRPSGLEKDAERLAADTSINAMTSRLAAAMLLSQHRSPQAVELLQKMEMDPEPAVARVAVARLIEIDSKLVLPALDHLLASPDANLRSLACKVLFQQPSAEHIHLLAQRLDDEHRGVRRESRDWLRQLAGKKEWHDVVVREASGVLAGEQWRGLEQAAILLVLLDHKPAAGRLVELLGFGRAEVVISAAWGLRRLAVPETLPQVLAFVAGERHQFKEHRGGVARPADFPRNIMDHVLSQLNQLLGEQKYAPADPVLRQFVPRGAAGVESRASAVYALGLIHEAKPNAELIGLLEARLTDTGPPPDEPRVRRMSAISLGRLMAGAAVSPNGRNRPFAMEHVKVLRYLCPVQQVQPDMLTNAAGWAIERITGEKVAAAKPMEQMRRDWFLSPFD
jgi:HEAT repeat protein